MAIPRHNHAIYSYTHGNLPAALKRVMVDVDSARSSGYAMIAFQVVESEHNIVVIYREADKRPTPVGYDGASLLGD